MSCRFLVPLALLAVCADAFLVGTPAARQRRSAALKMSDPNFYAVYHTFPKDTSIEDWWAGVADADFAAMAKEQHESGIFNHAFLPADTTGPILCIWETKDTEMGSAAFKQFIDGPTSPAQDLVNTVYPIHPSANGLSSAWPTAPAAPAASSGSFFWVQHTFNQGMSGPFWEGIADVDLDEFAVTNQAKGFHNHFFMPTTDPNTVFCVWESKTPMTKATFQKFIDEEIFPGTFTNIVHPVMEGAAVPSACFPVTGIDAWVDATMKKIEEVLPLSIDDMKKKGDELVAKFKEATKM